jgi:hypothetical protein
MQRASVESRRKLIHDPVMKRHARIACQDGIVYLMPPSDVEGSLGRGSLFGVVPGSFLNESIAQDLHSDRPVTLFADRQVGARSHEASIVHGFEYVVGSVIVAR